MSKEIITIRPSSLPLVSRCGASHQYLIDNSGNQFSVLGTACHKALFQRAQGQHVDFDKIGDEYGLDEEERNEMKYLVLGVIDINFRTNTVFEKKMTKKIGKVRLRGTSDVLEPADENNPLPVVYDYKTGRTFVSPRCLQLKAYAYLATKGKTDCKVVVIQLRDKDDPIKEHIWTAKELKDFGKTLLVYGENIKNKNCVVGPWCDAHYCAGRSHCKAYLAELSILLALDKKAELTPEQLGKYVAMKSTLVAIVASIDKHAKAFVDEHEVLPCGENLEYKKVSKTKEVIDSKAAIDLLVQLKGVEFAEKCFKITKALIKSASSAEYKETGEKGINTFLIDSMRDRGIITIEEAKTYKLVPVE